VISVGHGNALAPAGKHLKSRLIVIGAAQRPCLPDIGKKQINVVLNELYGLGFDHIKTYETKLKAVTAADLQQLAGSVLDMKRAVILVGMPEAQPQAIGVETRQ